MHSYHERLILHRHFIQEKSLYKLVDKNYYAFTETIHNKITKTADHNTLLASTD